MSRAEWAPWGLHLWYYGNHVTNDTRFLHKMQEHLQTTLTILRPHIIRSDKVRLGRLLRVTANSNGIFTLPEIPSRSGAMIYGRCVTSTTTQVCKIREVLSTCYMSATCSWICEVFTCLCTTTYCKHNYQQQYIQIDMFNEQPYWRILTWEPEFNTCLWASGMVCGHNCSRSSRKAQHTDMCELFNVRGVCSPQPAKFVQHMGLITIPTTSAVDTAVVAHISR